MIKIGLYINGERVDMFDDISVQVKDSIKKSFNIGEIFTQYTRPFKLPASKTNNKIFKHWYSAKIDDGFDGRRKHEAIITLNGADYRSGYIKILNVDIKNNLPNAYNIQFFGELTTLKDRMGEDTLPDIKYFERFDHEFNITNVRNGFEGFLRYNSTTGVMDANTNNGEIVYPLITHTKGLQYNATGGLSNINAVDPASPTSGEQLAPADLKPAVRVTDIIAGIEDEYDLDFQGDFLDSTVISELFLWCHRFKGGIRTDDPLTNKPDYIVKLQDFGAYDGGSFAKASDDPVGYDVEVHDQTPGVGQLADSDWDKYSSIGANLTGIDVPNIHDFIVYEYNFGFGGRVTNYTRYSVIATLTPDAAFTADYTFEAFNDVTGISYSQGTDAGNPVTLTFDILAPSNISAEKVDLNFKVASGALDEFDIALDITADRESSNSNGPRQRSWDYSITVTSAELITTAKVGFNLPKIKVIDFMRGLFKMFNLVAYQERNLQTNKWHIFVEPYQDFLQNGKVKNLSKWIDIEASTVERVSSFKQLNFDYKDKKTFIAIKSDEVSKIDFGSLKWNADSYGEGSDFLYDGGEYKVNLPFEKMVYERIVDSSAATTEISYGWFVNDFSENTPEPETGSPLLFYLNSRVCTTDQIEWNDGALTGDVGGGRGANYNAAANVKADDSQTLNFGVEFDEFTYLVNEESLFKNYFSDHVSSIYDIGTRRYKVTAYLPYEFMWNYRLNDLLVINGVSYYIQEITADLSTGKSSLDLLKSVRQGEVYSISTGGSYSDYDYADDGYWGDGYFEREDGFTSTTIPIIEYTFENSYQDIRGVFGVTDLTGTETYLNGAFDFDGATILGGADDTDKISEFTGDVPFSIELDVNFDTLGDVETMISKKNGTDVNYRLYKTGANEIAFELFTDLTNFIGIKSTNTVLAATDYTILMTYDGSELEGGMIIKIDTVAETPVSTSTGTYTGMVSHDLQFNIGAYDNTTPTNYLKGTMDNIKVYNAEL